MTYTKDQLRRLARENPDLGVPKEAIEPREPLTPAAKEWLKADRERLENRFLDEWNSLGGPPLVRQFHFNPANPKQAFDFVHLPSMTAIEIDGGLRMVGGGAHGGQNYHYQQQRDRTARGLGYEVIRLGTGWTIEQVEEALAILNGRCKP